MLRWKCLDGGGGGLSRCLSDQMHGAFRSLDGIFYESKLVSHVFFFYTFCEQYVRSGLRRLLSSSFFFRDLTYAAHCGVAT